MRRLPWLGFVAAGALGGSRAAMAGNFPPSVEASANPTEVLVGQQVMLSAAGTFDPDGGPEPLEFTWDFGDGTQAAGQDVVHAYDSRGLFTATVTASDGLASTLGFVDVVVVATPTRQRPRASTPIALSPDELRLAVANGDSGTVSIVDTGDASVTEHEVGGRPTTVAFTDDGGLVVVACADESTLWSLDPLRGDPAADVALPGRPWGVVVLADGRKLVTALDRAEVWIVDGDTVTAIATQPEPRAIAVEADGARAFVSHFRTTGATATVSVVDLTTDSLAQEIALAEDPGPDTASSGRGFPNLLGTAAITPAGDRLWIGGLKANTSRGALVDGNDLTPRNRVRGAMFPVDLTVDLVGDGGELLDRRLDTNDADTVTAIGFSPLGRFGYLVHQGAGRVSVYDLPKAALVEPGAGDSASFETRIDVGDAPNGIVVTAAGDRAWVRNELSRDLSVLDLSDPANATVAGTIVVTDEPLSAEIALGKRLFHRSRSPELSDQNYIACASCHPGGAHDGRTWDFTQAGEGLRNTTDLRGRAGTGDGPVHWSANFDEIQDFENDIVGGFGGTGLAADGMPPHPPLGPEPNAGRSAELDALAAYVASLDTAPRSPFRPADGGLSEAALRGKAIFFDEATGCSTCHAGSRFTDSSIDAEPFIVHDVGTILPSSGGHLGGALVGIDTPSLVGCWATPPYLHDGRAASLLDVLTVHNPDDAHGVTSQLDEAELADLVAFLLELQGDADEVPPGDGDTTGGGDSTDTGAGSGGDASTEGSGSAGSTGDAGSSSGGDTSGSAAASGDASGCACHTDASSRSLVSWCLLFLVTVGTRRRRSCS